MTIPDGLAAGDYTLKVFSEQCNGDKKTDYASAFQSIDLNVYLPQEATPNAVFTAANDNSGTLSGVDISMKYSVDGGTTWNDITGETMEITGVTAEQDIKVYKPGNGTTTSDSEVQTIDITQAAQPAGIDKADCTTSEQNNGQITGVDTTMEYKLSTDSVWKTITANPVTGLTDGTYEVRVKASGTVLASTAVTVTIGEHICAAQGDWQYNGTSHWKLCACGAKVEEAVHTGGTATCTEQATCEICGEKYGDLKPHSYSADWVTDETSHWHECTECGAKTDEAEHIDADKDHKCDVCEKVLSECADTNKDHKCDLCSKTLSEHIGGTATCKDKAICEVCGESYGELDSNNHADRKHIDAKAATKTAEGNIEYWYCSDCGKYFADKDGKKEITKAGTVTAKLPADSKSPQTGDNSNLALWIALLLIGGGAAVGLAAFGRKKKQSR